MEYSELNEIKSRHGLIVRCADIIGYLKSDNIEKAFALICQVADEEDMNEIRKIFERKLENMK